MRQAVLVSIASAFLLSLSMFSPAMAGDDPVMGNASYIIPADDLPKMRKEALLGSADSAQRLHKFFDFVVLDHSQALYWLQISAENGGAISQYNWGKELINRGDEQNRLRGIYWLRLAAGQGDEVAREWLRKFTSQLDP